MESREGEGILSIKFVETFIQLLDDDNEIVIENGIVVEGNGLCAIYDLEEEYFNFVCTTQLELETILSTRNLQMKELDEDEKTCSECAKLMQEGYYFESDGTMYCSKECLIKVIPWQKYVAIYDNGNGDAYWTDWYDC